MKNKIEKTNKTKFDYVARALGVFGFVIIDAVSLIGGITLSNMNAENRTLIAQIDKSENDIPYKVNRNNTSENVEGDYE